jgi:hypothetical protein
MHRERRETLSLDAWGHYDLAHAELVKARRALREGRITPEELQQKEQAVDDARFMLGRLDELAAPDA